VNAGEVVSLECAKANKPVKALATTFIRQCLHVPSISTWQTYQKLFETQLVLLVVECQIKHFEWHVM
jgi:hypothetical protein